jgi:predicted phosphodiesterase
MRIAIISDIHANRFAFEAVLADLRETTPDLVLHGGDLAHGGSSPSEIIDRIRDLGWPGVLGNTDEMLFRPAALTEFASQPPKLQSPKLQLMFAMIGEMAAWDREALGKDRLDWLSTLPLQQSRQGFALVHSSPASCWCAPSPDASDAELKSVYSQLGEHLVVYGHIHRPYIRKISGGNSDRTPTELSATMTIANSGSVSLSHDGDPRASYLLIDDGMPQIRRVPYDLEREIQALANCGMPHADWIARTLRAASPQMP